MLARRRSEYACTAGLLGCLRLTTQSRIGLGRAGDSLPTRHVLALKAAHAAARDAVHEPLNTDSFAGRVAAVGFGRPVIVTSRASNRSEYSRRPDLGRLAVDLTAGESAGEDNGLVLADGLSPRALNDHGVGLLEALVAELGAPLLARTAADRHSSVEPLAPRHG